MQEYIVLYDYENECAQFTHAMEMFTQACSSSKS